MTVKRYEINDEQREHIKDISCAAARYDKLASSFLAFVYMLPFGFCLNDTNSLFFQICPIMI